MWLRCRRIHTKTVIFAIVLLCCSVVFYYTSMHTIEKFLNDRREERNKHKHKPRQSSKTNVIVAQYIGTGNLLGHISQDLLNENNFSPVAAEGENGRPVAISQREMLTMQQQFLINRYNLLASDRIPLNRTLPDVRKKKCLLNNYYGSGLPDTTIIIVFHNEAWSVLLRTVWSVINRSPKHLLKEIILVDDASTRLFLGKPLEEYVVTLPIRTRVLRLPKREGLIAARLLGANNATGQVLTFLDAHCEATKGWLEPLLARVKQNRTNVVCPVIDIISDENFGYMKSFELHSGAFNWQLHFRWYLMNTGELRKRSSDMTQPFPSPAMAGGLFSIDRKYFFDLGSYDDKMKIWGGDNLEMSFRIWQCGGRIEIVPCSHVGHLFRKSSPYTFPGGVGEVLNENLARMALVWMDDWAQFFFKYFQIPESLVKSLDVSERRLLRRQLECKSFEWYLTEIWPDNFFPNGQRFFGKLVAVPESSYLLKSYQKVLRRATQTQPSNWTYVIDFLRSKVEPINSLLDAAAMLCLKQPEQSRGSLSIPYGQAWLGHCIDQIHMSEMFVIRADGHIMANEGICLDALDSTKAATNNTNIVRMVNCAESPRQIWSYDFQTQAIVNSESGNCLTASSDNVFGPASGDKHPAMHGSTTGNRYIVNTMPCKVVERQRWILLPFAWK